MSLILMISYRCFFFLNTRHFCIFKRVKNKCHTKAQMWNLENGIDDLLCKAEIETQTLRTDAWTPKGQQSGGMNWETVTDMSSTMYNRQLMRTYCTARGAPLRFCGDPKEKEIQKKTGHMFPRWRQWQRTRLPMQETQEKQAQSLSWGDPLEKGRATHSSVPAWRIPWTEEPGGLQSTGPQSVGHD